MYFFSSSGNYKYPFNHTWVRPRYLSSRWDNENKVYHYIVKVPEDDYYKYYMSPVFILDTHKVYYPKYYIRLKKFSDCTSMYMISMFNNVERDERVYKQQISSDYVEI